MFSHFIPHAVGTEMYFTIEEEDVDTRDCQGPCLLQTVQHTSPNARDVTSNGSASITASAEMLGANDATYECKAEINTALPIGTRRELGKVSN